MTQRLTQNKIEGDDDEDQPFDMNAPSFKDGEFVEDVAPGSRDTSDKMPLTPRKLYRPGHGHSVLKEASAELNHEIPDLMFESPEEHKKMAMASGAERRKLKKVKRQFDEKNKQLLLNLSECIHIYNNNEVSIIYLLFYFF